MAVKDLFEKDLEGKTPAQKKAFLRENEARKRWLVTYRDALGVQGKRRFIREDEAKRFDAEQKVSPAERLAEEAKTLTVQQMMDLWLTSKSKLSKRTLERYTYDAGKVTAAFGEQLARALKPADIQEWAHRDGVAASSRIKALAALRAGYELAIDESLVSKDPTQSNFVTFPKHDMSMRRSITLRQLEALADAAGFHGPLVWAMGTMGLRISEAAGLRVGDVLCSERKVIVARQRHTGEDTTPTKTRTPRRVPITKTVLNMLDLDRDPAEWLFLNSLGQPVNMHNWRSRVFKPACERASVNTADWQMVPHELRHTAATLAIKSGATVKDVQNMLGHRSAAMTLDLYGHLWEDDTVSDAVELMLQDYLAGQADIEPEQFVDTGDDDGALVAA